MEKTIFQFEHVIGMGIGTATLLLFIYFRKYGKSGLEKRNLVLWFLTLCLIPKAFGHFFLGDSAGRDFGGFDYNKGNPEVITTILFLYGTVQLVWFFWNVMFLMYDWKWVKTAIRVHFFASVILVLTMRFGWELLKEFPRIDEPANNALRPGLYIWLLELFVSFLFSI